MIYDKSQPEFPNWWDDLDEGGAFGKTSGFADGEGDTSIASRASGGKGSRSRDGVLRGEDKDRAEDEDGEDRAPAQDRRLERGSRDGWDGGDGWDGERVGEASVGLGGWRRGYSRDVVESVWEFGMIVAGNDPEIWRKDEFGNWIHRFSYGRRDSRYGWVIFDPGVGRHHQGVLAMRPMQWEGYLRYCELLA